MAIINTEAQFDESEGKAFEFPYAPKGVYEARITAATDKASSANSKNPGTPMWMIEAALTDPEQETVRVTWFQQVPAGEGSEWMDDAQKTKLWNEIKRLWNACGLDGDGGQIDSDDLLNMDIRLDLGVEEYPKDSGTMKNTVKDVLSI
jgi:hypothetical protein